MVAAWQLPGHRGRWVGSRPPGAASRSYSGRRAPAPRGRHGSRPPRRRGAPPWVSTPGGGLDHFFNSDATVEDGDVLWPPKLPPRNRCGRLAGRARRARRTGGDRAGRRLPRRGLLWWGDPAERSPWWTSQCGPAWFGVLVAPVLTSRPSRACLGVLVLAVRTALYYAFGRRPLPIMVAGWVFNGGSALAVALNLTG